MESKYKKYDIVDYDDICNNLGDGFGQPGIVDIVTTRTWYPANMCTTKCPEYGIWSPVEWEYKKKEEYGRTWVAVYNNGDMDNQKIASAGQAYLLNV